MGILNENKIQGEECMHETGLKKHNNQSELKIAKG